MGRVTPRSSDIRTFIIRRRAYRPGGAVTWRMAMTRNPHLADNQGRVAADICPLSTDKRLMSTDNRLMSADTRLMSTDIRPLSTDTRPMSADIRPLSTDIRPVSTGIRPLSTDNGLILGYRPAHDASTVTVPAGAIGDRVRSASRAA